MFGTSLRQGLLISLCALAATGPAAGQSFITFNADSGDDTYAYAINAVGVVAGALCGEDYCYGFVRATDGTITIFYGPDTLETIALSINREGSIAGTYFTSAGHGFLRKRDGKFITFDPPGSTDTEAWAINDSGVITGVYNTTHGFIRAADGTFTSFDLSDSIETIPTAINAAGDVAGYYWDTQNKAHGFLRTADGTITSFDAKKKGFTKVYGINAKDTIVGSHGDTIGFERTQDGKIKTFERGLPLTQASAINDKGQIVGFYTTDQSPHGYGYVRSRKTGLVSFNVPNGSQTQPFAINDKGVIAGSYVPASGPLTGFLRMP